MPQGKGTYGSQVGRPPKKGKKAGKRAGSVGAERAGPKDTYERQFGVKPQSLQDYKDRKTMQEIKTRRQKYYGGGRVDPFSSKNSEGVVAKQAMEAIDEMNTQKEIQESIPTVNAMERSQSSPDTEKYNKGGKVKSKKINITDIVKEVESTFPRTPAIPMGADKDEYGMKDSSKWKIKGMKKEILKKSKKKGKKK